ncbi:hypothetical protein SLS63_000437 [Diaporthe eres]|uniref:Ecp2 effector protein domain-containing protein n=1 Tax=Diaporthe eres TaxID=83184 RepID=A0ABR1PQR4_DIAER
MKLTNILLLTPLIAAGAKAQQNHPGLAEDSMAATNETASPRYGNDLATLERQVVWLPLEEDQEACAYGEAKTVGEKVVLKADCQKVVDYVSGRSGYWTVTGYGRGDLYALLFSWGTCSFDVARVDDVNLYFQ